MLTTLTVCSWLLAALGAGVTVWLIPHPLMLLPYCFLFPAIRASRRVLTRTFVLALTLASVCIQFWYCWDAAFIHLSTLNFDPAFVSIYEAAFNLVAWLVIRRMDIKTSAPRAA